MAVLSFFHNYFLLMILHCCIKSTIKIVVVLLLLLLLLLLQTATASAVAATTLANTNYYSSCTSTIFIDDPINCRFTYLLITLNLLYADGDINSLERVVNAELSKVQEWLVATKLTC